MASSNFSLSTIPGSSFTNPAAQPGYTAPGGGQTPAYNVNPGPQGGQGAYGAVPGAIGLPSPQADLAAAYPNLSGATAKTSGDIMSELSGELSPETQNNIANTAASFGVSSGMPLSGLSRNKQLASLGLTTEQLQHQGIGDFLAGTQGVSKTQTLDPALQAEIASRNATFRAAPDPGAADSQAQALFQQQQMLARYGQNGGNGRATVSGGPAFAGQGAPPNISATQTPGNAPAVGPTGFMAPAPITGGTPGTAPASPAGFSGEDLGNFMQAGPGSMAQAFGGINPYAIRPDGNSGGTTSFLDANGQPIGAPPAGSGNAGQNMSDDLYNLSSYEYPQTQAAMSDYSGDY